jgi:Na+-driven multidrug efflux pump
LGKTVHASVITGISYWVISLPMEYLFAFHFGFGVIGLWVGQMCGSIFHAISYIYLVNFHFGDWVKLSEHARQEIEDENARLESKKQLLLTKGTQMVEITN